MTSEKDGDEGDVPPSNVLRITDELVRQVDRTKRIVVVMILAVILAVPVTWHAAPLVSGSPVSFKIVGYVTILVALAFVAVGARQWMVLSKWTRRYKRFKELQRKVDRELDFEDGA